MKSKKINMEFLAAISHEIRNPLNILINLVHLLKGADTEEDKQNYVNGLVETSQNLLELVNNIMDFSKLESGKLHYVYTPTDLNKSIEEHLVGHRMVAEAKGLSFILELDDRLASPLLADSVKLNQVILNLVSNAVKFTQEGNISVAVRTKGRSRDQVIVEFEIRDTGKGIPPEKLKNIFEAFDQGSEEINLEFGGTGLGLSISEQVIANMGGELKVSSEPGVGTQFLFELPFSLPTETSFQVPGAKEEPEALSPDATVLIVDDSEFNMLVIRKALENTGWKTLSARSGITAIKLLQEHVVDIVLMDIHMPGMDGFEAVQVIRKLPGMDRLPIIAVTGSTTPDLISNLPDSGFSDHILKPFHPEELTRKIAAVLRAEAY